MEDSMENEHNLSSGSELEDYPKPPSVSAELWDQIPQKLRADFIKRAAIFLIKGVHPEDTIREMLAEKGISSEPIRTISTFFGRTKMTPKANVPPRNYVPSGSFGRPKGLQLLQSKQKTSINEVQHG